MGKHLWGWLCAVVLIVVCGVLVWQSWRGSRQVVISAPPPVPPSTPGAGSPWEPIPVTPPPITPPPVTPEVPPPVPGIPPPAPTLVWRLVPDMIDVLPAAGSYAKLPEKLTLGFAEGAACHYRLNLYAGLNRLVIREGDLKDGESLEIPRDTVQVALQVEGRGSKGQPLVFRGLWRQVFRPRLEVINGVAVILGEDGILKRLDLAKTPNGIPEIIPGIETLRFVNMGYLSVQKRSDSKADVLWGLRDDDTLVFLRKDWRRPTDPPNASWFEQDKRENSIFIGLSEPGVEAPPLPSWETGPFRIYRLPVCKEDVLTINGGGRAKLVDLAFRNHQAPQSSSDSFWGDGKGSALLSNGQLFSLETFDGRQFQPTSLPDDPFVVWLGGKWTLAEPCGGSTSWGGERLGFHPDGNRFPGIVGFDGRVLEISGENDSKKKSTVAVSQPSGIISEDDIAKISFARSGGWSWQGNTLAMDRQLTAMVVRKLCALPNDFHRISAVETPRRILCLDNLGVVRLLCIAAGAVRQEREWRDSVFVDIAVAREGYEMPQARERFELPQLWALTAQGKVVCLDPASRDPSLAITERVRTGERMPVSAPAPTETALSVTPSGGFCAVLPVQVKINANNAAAPITYRVLTFQRMTRLAVAKGTVLPGKTLELPTAGAATAMVLELSQDNQRQRVLWTLDPREGSFPLLLLDPPKKERWASSRNAGNQGVRVMLAPDDVRVLNARVLKRLVEEGLRLPGDVVSVPAGKSELWRFDPAVVKETVAAEADVAQAMADFQRLLPHRELTIHAPDARFFLAQDGALYRCENGWSYNLAVALVEGWGGQHRPAVWGGDSLVDETGRLHRIRSQLQLCGYFSRSIYPNMLLKCHVSPVTAEVVMVGRTLAGDFWDVDGNLWIRGEDKNENPNPFELPEMSWKKLTLPPGVADAAWVSFEPNPSASREQTRVLLMEDGSVEALYQIRGRNKLIRFDGVSWKEPGKLPGNAGSN